MAQPLRILIIVYSLVFVNGAGIGFMEIGFYMESFHVLYSNFGLKERK